MQIICNSTRYKHNFNTRRTICRDLSQYSSFCSYFKSTKKTQHSTTHTHTHKSLRLQVNTVLAKMKGSKEQNVLQKTCYYICKDNSDLRTPPPSLTRGRSEHTTLVNSGHSLKSLISLKPYFQPGGKNVRTTSRCQFCCLADTQCVSIPHLPKIIPLSTETEPLQIRLGLGLGAEQMVLQN